MRLACTSLCRRRPPLPPLASTAWPRMPLLRLSPTLYGPLPTPCAPQDTLVYVVAGVIVSAVLVCLLTLWYVRHRLPPMAKASRLAAVGGWPIGPPL